MINRISRRSVLVSAGIAASAPALAQNAGKGLSVQNLMTENVSDPLGVQRPDVRLSWQLRAQARGTRQTAYAVQVSSTLAKLQAGEFDLWDSGRINSDQSFNVRYNGKPLVSRQRACWRVKVWDNFGNVATSPSAFWEMGLLAPADWRGKWLAAEDAEMRADREAGLFWLSSNLPPQTVKTSEFRLNFALPVAADVTFFTVAKTGYRAFADGAALELPAYSKLAFGGQGTVATKMRLPRGKHVLGVSVDNPSISARSNEAKPACAMMVRAVAADGTTLRFDDTTVRTSFGTPSNWAMPAFDDSHWTLATADRTTSATFPGKGAFAMRREFALARQIVSARLYTTALGSYEAYLNGQRVGDDHLAPEFTDFSKRALYRVHDVTKLLKKGDNAFGALVGDGWYGSHLAPRGRFGFGPAPLRYIAQLEVTYDNGDIEVVTTDELWMISPSAVTMSEIYDGEDYDARLEQPGWTEPNFKPTGPWAPVATAPAASGRLEGMISPPIRRVQSLKAQSIKVVNGSYVVDFGQNFAGWGRISVKGAAGDKVTLRFAEVLNADGSIDQSNLRSARAADNYVLKGDPAGETFEPHFTYHGFRYVEVSGLKSMLRADDIVGIVVHSDLQETGHLRIGNPLIQQLWQNTLWSQRSNFVGIPTDCPQRDERLGWMGDANVFWDAASFNMDVAAFTERFAGDIRDAQMSTGAFTNVSPDTLRETGAPGWADAGVMLPWTVWKRFGDTAIIDQHWAAMVRYIDFVLSSSEGFIWTKNRGEDFGDWLSLDSKFPGDATTPKELLATAGWKHSVDAIVDMANASGRTEEQNKYATLSANIKSAFIKAFVKVDGTVSNDSQTGYILALRYDLLPAELRAAAAAKLQANIMKRGDLLTTGFLGTPGSLDVLSDFGYDKTVYDLLLRTAYPSWGYMVARGATTIWERWNGDTGDVSMNSYNHYSLGAVTGFIFRRIAGLDPIEPGFKTFAVNPVLDARVKVGGGDFDSMLGRLSTDWEQGPNGAFHLSLTVPANAKALVYLPAKSARQVKERSKDLAGHPDLKIRGRSGDRLVLEVGSGQYDFSVNS